LAASYLVWLPEQISRKRPRRQIRVRWQYWQWLVRTSCFFPNVTRASTILSSTHGMGRLQLFEITSAALGEKCPEIRQQFFDPRSSAISNILLRRQCIYTKASQLRTAPTATRCFFARTRKLDWGGGGINIGSRREWQRSHREKKPRMTSLLEAPLLVPCEATSLGAARLE